MTGIRERDRLTAVVERAIEHHLPGGTFGVDIPTMAHEVVRQGRRQLAIERLEGQPPSSPRHSMESTRPAGPAQVQSMCVYGVWSSHTSSPRLRSASSHRGPGRVDGSLEIGHSLLGGEPRPAHWIYPPLRALTCGRCHKVGTAR